MTSGRDGSVVRDAVIVAVNDRVTHVGRRDEVSTFDGLVDDLGDVFAVPGLVNAHTHLELSHARPGERPTHLADWLTKIVLSRSARDDELHARAAVAARAGAAECLAAGVTTVGDVTRFPAATRAALNAGPLRVVSFGEVQSMASRRAFLPQRLTAATDTTRDTPHLVAGVSPHAPYTVEADAYRQCLAWASATGRPLATHVAEADGEGEFLATRDGPFRRLWDALGVDLSDVATFDGTPVAFMSACGLLDALVPVVLAHVNHVTRGDVDLLAAGRASVAYCPRTLAFFGHPPHPFETLLAKGVNVCLATDSRASSPDLDLLAEARFVYAMRPHLPASLLWAMITRHAAAALGIADAGTLSPGSHADFVLFADPGGDEPLRSLLLSDARPVATYVRGRRV